MNKKRNLDRERLEVILMHILMRFRLYLMIGGVILLVASLYFTTVSPWMSLMGSLMALLMMLPFFSFEFTLFAAKVGAWFGTLGSRP